MAVTLERSKRITIGKNENIDDKINADNLKMLQRYKRDMQMRELSNKTIYNYETDIMAWFRYLYLNQFNPSIIDMTEDDIEEFIFYCKEEGNNTNRIKRRMASISAFYKFLRKKKIIKDNPMEFIDRPKKGLPVVAQTFLSIEQYEQLKEKLIDHGDLQLRAFILFGISTMGRVNALSNVTWSQIDFKNRAVDDVLEKEGYIVTLYFSEEVEELLKEIKKYREENNIETPYVFSCKYNGSWGKCDNSTLNQWCKKAGKLIGIDTFHCHDLRHSGSQLLNLVGMPIERISELLNHKGLDVTKNHYLKQDKKKIQEEKDKYKL